MKDNSIDYFPSSGFVTAMVVVGTGSATLSSVSCDASTFSVLTSGAGSDVFVSFLSAAGAVSVQSPAFAS